MNFLSSAGRLVPVVVAAALLADPASAAPVTLDFNALGNHANNATVQTHIQAALTANGYDGTVRVTGAGGSQGYDGEGYVVGPRNGDSVTSLTLGNTDGGQLHGQGWDNFLINTNGTTIVMEFSEPIYGVAFDFEIFPNGNVPDGTDPHHRPFPDFTFNAYLDGQSEVHFHVISVLPHTGRNAYSPNSVRRDRAELAPQYLGSGVFQFPGGVNRLEFIDWPERIGVDNLQLQLAPPVTVMPEPSSLVLLAGSLSALVIGSAFRRRQWRRGNTPSPDR